MSGESGSFLELLPNLTQSGEVTKDESLSAKRANKRELNEQFRRNRSMEKHLEEFGTNQGKMVCLVGGQESLFHT